MIQKAKQNDHLVAITKANSDSDFAASNDAFDAIVNAILGATDATSEVTDTVPSGRSLQPPMELMELMTTIGLHEWLSGRKVPAGRYPDWSAK